MGYTGSLQMTEAAVGLIGKAKNRLAKFYNPSVYKAAPKKEISMEDKIVNSYGFVQRHAQEKKQMPDIPELPEHKQQNSGGVVALLDKIVADLEHDKVVSQHDEKNAQGEYVEFMADSQATREQNQKTMVDKKASKAELESKVVEGKASLSTSFQELQNSHQFLSELHSQCDFMVENFEARQTARSAEIESLKNAKSVLAGASL